MTAIRGYIPPSGKPDQIGVHSLDQFVLQVPDLKVAENFYTRFGLDISTTGNALSVKTFGHDQRWGSVVEGRNKRLHHLSFGCFADDLPALKARIEANGVRLLDPPDGFESNSIWFRDFAGLLIEIKVAPKSSPDKKVPFAMGSLSEGTAASPMRKNTSAVQPRRMSHVLIFTTSIDQAIRFYSANLGLRLSDRSGDIVAFMHGIHGSDHHLLAFALSSTPGMHHCSWDVPKIDDIGLGAQTMADSGFSKGWGLGRHVLGSNYFHYIQDPWGSFCEYSCDIDYIPKTKDWEAGDFAPEDSFYLWGPEPPPDFTFNYEAALDRV